MKVINQSYEIISENNLMKRIEICGRVCYKSEDKITESSAENFIDRIVERGHTSVLEHAQVRITDEFASDLMSRRSYTSELDMLKAYGAQYRMVGYTDGKEHYTLLNARDFLNLGGTLEELKTLEHCPEDFFTVRFITDRGVTHELVRHRMLSFSQESTRYVNYASSDIQFIKPANTMLTTEQAYKSWEYACLTSEQYYKKLVTYCGASPQEARSVLNNSVKTEIIVSGPEHWWRHMLYLRTTIGAHPQIRELMTDLNSELGLV